MLPADLDQGFDAPPAVIWKRLEGTDRKNAAARVDLVLKVATEEIEQGEQGWRARTAVRLGLPEDEGSLNTMGTLVKVGNLFRRPYPHGLGWSRDKVTEHAIQRLRVFSSHPQFSTDNPERVEELLATDMNESDLRATVSEAVKAKKELGEERVFKNLSIRLPELELGELEQAIEAAIKKFTYAGHIFPKARREQLGEAIALMANEWLGYAWDVEVDGGDTATVSNSMFMPTSTLNVTDEQMIEASATEMETYGEALDPMSEAEIADSLIPFNLASNAA